METGGGRGGVGEGMVEEMGFRSFEREGSRNHGHCESPLPLFFGVSSLLERSLVDTHRRVEGGEAMAAAPGKCFLLTGPPGVGKSTLIVKVLESLGISKPNLNIKGFYTREIKQGGQRVGFEVVTLDGGTGPLASTMNSSPESVRWPSVGRYKVDVASFESLALAELQVKEDVDVFIIDEIGKMELFSASFFPAVLKVLESNVPVLATVPIPKNGRDIPGVARVKNHPGATIFNVTTANRDMMKEQVYSTLLAAITKN